MPTVRWLSATPPQQSHPPLPVLVVASGGTLLASMTLGSLAAVGTYRSWQNLPPHWWDATASESLISEVLSLVLGASGVALAAWYCVSCLLLLLAGLTRSQRLAQVVRHWGAPFLRRLARGFTVGTLATATWLTPALALPGVPEPPDPIPALTWPLTAPPSSTAPTLTWPTTSPPPTPPTSCPPARHLVQPGDSLWHIAAQYLPATATPTEIDAAWRLVYAANAAQIGPDPDFLLPGHTLTIPKELTP
ncbi:LysM peptidoglycan-binding domain-containing protein [Buchananella hordeovulneris]|uniref:LysM peptidoglycan-binding domain-containing protein n=1 Tax=Buchananella hordeovulneris TaxID=52770 RepID=UPI0026DCC6A5|nr:LysM domain-containing protein [Buchananella hordeovulneris]MDO5079820.1 LysM domain-containing protein [Buchananella hordeovulneris]